MPRLLRDAATVHYGKSPSEVLSEDGEVPVIGTGGVYDRAARQLFSGPAIVVPRKGSLGNPQYVDGPFWPADTTYAVAPHNEVDARWLYYHLDHFDLTKLNEATGVPSISRDWLYRVPLGDEGYPEQQRIAKILSTVDEATEQTEALIAKTQQIKAGLMHDLFTRGVTPDGRLRPPREEAPQLYKESPLGWIPKEWDDAKLGSVIGKIDSGWSPICAAEPAGDGEWAVLKTTAVVWPGYDPAENKALLPGADRLEGITVKKDDILITRKGPVDRVGVAVHVPKTPPNLMFPDTVFRTRVTTPGEVSPDFLALAMGSPAVQKFWWQRKVGLADAQVNLNHGILRKTPIPKPSPDEQRAICERSDAFNDALAHLATEVRKLKAEKAGLMHDLLTGHVSVQLPAGANV